MSEKKRRIPSASPLEAYLAHKREIDLSVSRVLASGNYILGGEVDAFEKEFAGYTGARYAVGVSNGTEALSLALWACGIGPGDRVATVAHTAVATAAAIGLCGAVPVMVDIDARSFTIDPQRLEDTLKEMARPYRGARRVKCVIPVHLYGRPADMAGVNKIARRYGAPVIEDCAQAHGASIDGRKVGTWGRAAAFSFYPTKNLAALGDAGAVVTDDAVLADRARGMRQYGWRRKDRVSRSRGMNSRLDEIQAAVLRARLRHLDRENARRRKIAFLYDKAFSAIPEVISPSAAEGMFHVYHQYVIRIKNREGLRNFLKKDDIMTAVHYPVPVHLQPAYRNRVVIGAGGLGNTEKVCREVLSLPLYPQMSDSEARRISAQVAGWCSSRRTRP